MSIQNILQKYARPAVALSDEPVKQGLLADLNAQKKFNSRVYTVLFIFICAIAVLGFAALLTDAVKGLNQRYALIAAAGVSIPTTLEWMRRVIREWSQLNLLITLVGSSDEKSIQLLIERLLSASALGNAKGD
jgi:hypothetical protein